MAIENVTEPDTLIMVSTPETNAAMLAEQSRLVKQGITSIIFPSQQLANEFCDRHSALRAHYAAMELALKRQTDRNAKRRATRRAQVQAA